MIVTQGEFTRGIFDPDMAVPEGLLNADGTQAAKRFNVYRNNVAVSLTEALIAAFPVIYKLVGDQFFRGMAGIYLRKHKPTSPLMMYYGERMPMFLGRFQPAKSLPYLADMAQLELAMRQAYHAGDGVPMDGAKLAALAPTDLMGVRFAFAPATRVVSSDYAIDAIYRANTSADAPAVVMQPETVLITRPNFDPQMHVISPAGAACIEALMKNQPLGVAISQAGDDLDLGAILGLLLAQGAITDLILKED